MFQPVIPSGGLVGWRFLQRTYDAQLDAFSSSASLKRDSDYFAETIDKVGSAEELVSDRRLLTVALGAFGLQDDIDNRFFIQKVLEEGTTAEGSLALRLSDTRYGEMSAAFAFGPGEVRSLSEADFAQDIVARYQSTAFEVAAGAQDNTMRVALYGQREVPALATSDRSIDAMWFTVLGDPPMRQLFETALNLPSSFGQIDIDQQLSVIKERAESVLGSSDLSQFSDDDAVEDLITKFVVRDQVRSLNTGLTSGSIALSLLQSF